MIQTVQNNAAGATAAADATFNTMVENLKQTLASNPDTVTLNANIFTQLSAIFSDTAGTTYSLNAEQTDHLKWCYQALKTYKPSTAVLAGLFADPVDTRPTEPSPIAPPLMRMGI